MITDVVEKTIGWAVAALLGGCVYLVRRVFTNEQQIALYKKDLDARDMQRAEQNRLFSTALDRLGSDVQEIKEEMRYLRRTRNAD